jgi:archaellum component FlaG (FlaF/FlaG flagellin family)
MTIKPIIIIAASLIMISATARGAGTDDAIEAAEKAQQQAASVGYEWRDTAKILNDAKKLAAEGKSAEAVKLARVAEEQGKDAYAQYHAEQERYRQNH